MTACSAAAFEKPFKEALHSNDQRDSLDVMLAAAVLHRGGPASPAAAAPAY